MLVFDAMLPRNHSTMVIVYLIGASAAVKCNIEGPLPLTKTREIGEIPMRAEDAIDSDPLRDTHAIESNRRPILSEKFKIRGASPHATLKILPYEEGMTQNYIERWACKPPW